MEINELNSAYGEGLSWLLEMNLISNPAVANALVLNVFKVSKNVKDVELLTDTDNKRMLIWVKLDWLGRKFRSKKILGDVEKIIQSALPSYELRATEDRSLFEKSIAIMKAKRFFK